MYCFKCGTKVVDDAVFCHKCGQALISSGNSKLEEARRMLDMNEYETAEKLLIDITKEHPNNGEAWFLLYRASLKKKINEFVNGNAFCPVSSAKEAVEKLDACNDERYKSMAIKLYGASAVDDVIKEETYAITKLFIDSGVIFQKFEKNLKGLVGYCSLGDDHYEGFSEYQGEVYFTTGSYEVYSAFKVLGIQDGYLILKNVMSHNQTISKFKMAYIKHDTIAIVDGKLGYYVTKSSDFSAYEDFILRRQNLRQCKVCGASLTFFGKCPNMKK